MSWFKHFVISSLLMLLVFCSIDIVMLNYQFQKVINAPITSITPITINYNTTNISTIDVKTYIKFNDKVYWVQDQIGRGTQGIVYLVQDKIDGKQYAMKWTLDSGSGNQCDMMENEYNNIYILMNTYRAVCNNITNPSTNKHCNHQTNNIYGFERIGNRARGGYQCAFIMDFISDSTQLFKYGRSINEGHSMNDILSFVVNCSDDLNFQLSLMHVNNLYYTNPSGNNVLYDNKLRCYWIDYGQLFNANSYLSYINDNVPWLWYQMATPVGSSASFSSYQWHKLLEPNKRNLTSHQLNQLSRKDNEYSVAILVMKAFVHGINGGNHDQKCENSIIDKIRNDSDIVRYIESTLNKTELRKYVQHIHNSSYNTLFERLWLAQKSMAKHSILCAENSVNIDTNRDYIKRFQETLSSIESHYFWHKKQQIIYTPMLAPITSNASASASVWEYLEYWWGPVHINTEQKLSYCAIMKNAITIFKNLFLSIKQNNPLIGHVNDFYNKRRQNLFEGFFLDNMTKYFDILNDESWTKLVIIRDPLERLVSGFLNICVQHNFCEGTSPTNNFTIFVERLISNAIQKKQINVHYKPQATFCDLMDSFNRYNYVIKYDATTIGNNTLDFLQFMNLTQYYMHWGPHHNLTMFAEKTRHSTYLGGDLKRQVRFYQKYYDKRLAQKCLNLFEIDYKLLNLEPPEWIEHLK